MKEFDVIALLAFVVGFVWYMQEVRDQLNAPGPVREWRAYHEAA